MAQRLTGSSGARITVSDAVVLKMGDHRVGDQGAWLRRHGDIPGLVRVFDTSENWYTMERLHTLPWPIIDGQQLLAKTLRILREVWDEPSEGPVDFESHIAYVEKRATEWAPALASDLVYWAESLPQDRYACLTHGDPTFDNVLLRGDEVVLIDPIPQPTYMPPWYTVDLGKLLQSITGYERLRWGRPSLGLVPNDLLADLDSDDVETAWYFCAVHYLRLLPYMPDDVVPVMREKLEDIVRRGHG